MSAVRSISRPYRALRRLARPATRRWVLARVHGVSMLPTLAEGDLLLADRRARPRRGDLVVARWPGTPLVVKRVLRREPDGWWLERDNPRAGTDSWLAGTVTDDDLVAVVRLRLWPRPGPVA
jgi:phage repressor protein C with HTH and peptisase S24 domain